MNIALSQSVAIIKEETLTVHKGFTVTNFAIPYEVDLFIVSDSFNPAKAMAIGVELNNTFGSKRLIVKPTTPITRKVTNEEAFWPGNLLYVSARDIRYTMYEAGENNS